MFDSLLHLRGALNDAKRKLKGAQADLDAHYHRKKPCEDCAKHEETGYGREWHCDRVATLVNRIHRYRDDVDSARNRLYKAEEARRAADQA